MFQNSNILEDWSSVSGMYDASILINIPNSISLNRIEITSKIKSFHSLSEGWHYGVGGPIESDIIDQAHKWVEILFICGFTDLNAFPGFDKEILLSADYNDFYIELIIENDKSFSIVVEKDDEPYLYKSRISANEAQEVISEITENKWIAYDCYIPVISIPAKAASQGLHSEIPPIAMGSQSYLQNVSQENSIVFATISENTMPEYQGSLRYSGALMPQMLLKVA
jgi:hypothetical protein